MSHDQSFSAALKASKQWANTYAIISIVLVAGLLSATAFVAETAYADITTRIGMSILVVAIVIVTSVWQAAAFVAAAIQKALADMRANGLGPIGG